MLIVQQHVISIFRTSNTKGCNAIIIPSHIQFHAYQDMQPAYADLMCLITKFTWHSCEHFNFNLRTSPSHPGSVHSTTDKTLSQKDTSVLLKTCGSIVHIE